jgi:hypothetical protein
MKAKYKSKNLVFELLVTAQFAITAVYRQMKII